MNVFYVLLEITIYSGVIFTAVMLLKTLLKNRMSPLLHYAVWALFVVRLLIPATIASPVHLFVIPAEAPAGTLEQQTELRSYETVSQHENTTSNTPDNRSRVGIDPYGTTTTSVNSPGTAEPVTLSLPDILLAVWLAGVGICLLYLISLYFLLCRNIRRSGALPSKKLAGLFEEVKTEMGVRGHIKLLCLYEYGTPALMFPRTVLMPADALVAMDDEQTKLALRHELMHFKRFDHAVSTMLAFLNAVYWFNPFVWLALSKMRADMEIACDGSVVKTMDSVSRNRYASLIVSLFAQPKHRQLVLGMARGNAKSIAEKRVRGIFADDRSKRGVKLISGLLAALLIVTCFTTACKPTPESAIVQRKDPNAPAQANAVLYRKADFPDSYKDSFSKNGADITFDAAVELPDSDLLPTYDASPATFSQAQVDTIIKTLFGNAQMYKPAEATKAEIEPAYLKALSELNDKKANPDQYENTLDYYQSEVDRLKAELEKAVEADTLVPVDSKLTKSSQQGTEYYGGRGDTGKDKMAQLTILNNTDSPYQGDNSFLMFKNGDEYVDMSSYFPEDIQDNGPTNLKTTKAEAIAQADDIVSRLGAGYMEYAGCDTGVELSDNGQLPEYDPQAPQAYIIHYVRVQNGVPVTYDRRNITNTFTDLTSENNEDAYTAPQAYERINVTIDDTGITYISWQGLMTVSRASVENNRIIPFNDVMTLAKNQLGYYFAAYGQQPMASGYAVAQPSSPVDVGDTVSNHVHIQRITLGLMQLPVKDEDRWQLVPVWDFFGYYESEYYTGAKEMHYRDKESLLTINAVDGSVIDRNKGY